MIAIQLFATPVATVNVRNSISYIEYHIATLYRNKERYKVTITYNLSSGTTVCVSGKTKATGWEPFCKKWAERFKKWSGMISWGHSWKGSSCTSKLEAEISLHCDRLQVITSFDREEHLKILKSLALGFSFTRNSHWASGYDDQWSSGYDNPYSSDYLRLLAIKKSGWCKTHQIK